MTPIIEIPITEWNQECPPEVRERALDALEDGCVVFLPHLAFSMDATEADLLSPDIMAKGKNISFNPATGKLSGSSLSETATRRLEAMMRRFAEHSRGLLLGLLRRYKKGLVQARTSFRPVGVERRATSWRKDDTRLHIDSFPSSPVRDRRILRVFSNVNPKGRERTWRLGESFECVASRYLPHLPRPVWGSSRILHACGITKSRRSAYDHFMLRIHDRMKADLEYQEKAEQRTCDFPAGSTWMVFTDQVSHAAISGQHVLEQTFHVPVDAMKAPSRSPLRILERRMNRELV